jgi:hypothetical protein
MDFSGKNPDRHQTKHGIRMRADFALCCQPAYMSRGQTGILDHILRMRMTLPAALNDRTKQGKRKRIQHAKRVKPEIRKLERVFFLREKDML